MTQLNVLHTAPDSLFLKSAAQLHEVLSGPTIIHFKGRREPALFVSVLLHGNETSGWDALCSLMVERLELPRTLIVFIANVDAATAGVRHLPEQLDYNRIWRDAPDPEGILARAVLQEIKGREMFAAIDLHNNTGHNPHYSVLTRTTPQNLNLGYLMSNQAVLVEEPDTVLTRALDKHCPAITVELGPVGDREAVERARRLLDQCLELDSLTTSPPPDMVLYRAVARVHVANDIQFGFAGDTATQNQQLTLTGGLEAVNFHPLPTATEFARTMLPVEDVLSVHDPAHTNVTHQFLRMEGERVVFTRDVVPAMYTTDKEVIRQDCLCYLMEPLDYQATTLP